MVDSILGNPLVLKYFCVESGPDCKENMALRVLEATQEPVKIGQKYLYITSDNQWHEHTASVDSLDYSGSWHPGYLRLPQRFQPQTEGKCETYCDCSCHHPNAKDYPFHGPQPPPDAVCEHCDGDKEIRNPKGFCDHLRYPENCDVCSLYERIIGVFDGNKYLRNDLSKLVRLARAPK